ncbi:hypothetical protein D3C85_1436090 [compost metagenome]
MIEQHEVPLRRQPAQVHFKLLAPLRNLAGHLGDQRRALLVIHALSRFIEIIHHHNADRELLFFIALTQHYKLGDIIQI